MNKVRTYKIFDDKQLIVEYYSGEITVDDFIFLKNVMSKEATYNFAFNTVLDVRSAFLKMNEKDLLRLMEFLNNKFKGATNRRVAYLTKKPNDVVQSTIFSSLVETKNDLKMKLGTFSTIDAIVKWFDTKEIDCKTLTECFEELKFAKQ